LQKLKDIPVVVNQSGRVCAEAVRDIGVAKSGAAVRLVIHKLHTEVVLA
jgi:hypothetical protein